MYFKTVVNQETWKDNKFVFNEPLYHMSFDSNLPNVLKPRQPYLINTDSKEQGLPNRVSFSPTLRGCFIALFYNIPEHIRESKYLFIDFYVYRLIYTKELKHIPKDLMLKHVFDYKLTEEVAITEPCNIKKIALVSVSIDHSKPILDIGVTKAKTEEDIFAYEPRFKVIKKYVKENIVISRDTVL